MLIASALCAGAASAQSSADISVTDFTFTLVDLDLNDGIDPSLTFSAPLATQPSLGAVHVTGTGSDVSDMRQGAAAFAPLDLNAASSYGQGTSSLSGTLASGFSMQLNGGLAGLPGMSGLSNELTTGYLGFVLSPMTAVTFSTRVMMSLGLDVGVPPISGFSTGSVRMDLRSDVGGANEQWNALVTQTTSNGQIAYDSPLTFTLANALGMETSNELQFSSSILAQVAAPVPEPTTWAMFIGGLALLAAHARARWSRQAARLRK